MFRILLHQRTSSFSKQVHTKLTCMIVNMSDVLTPPPPIVFVKNEKVLELLKSFYNSEIHFELTELTE